jgi:hypothetical protein
MFAKLGQTPRYACRHDRLKHLPCGRHIMHFIEIEFFRRRHADQKRDVRGEEDDSGNSIREVE